MTNWIIKQVRKLDDLFSRDGHWRVGYPSGGKYCGGISRRSDYTTAKEYASMHEEDRAIVFYSPNGTLTSEITSWMDEQGLDIPNRLRI